MDVERLRIERKEGARRKRRRLAGPLVLLALAALGLWWFHRPLLDAADRWRLPAVEVARAVRRSPAAAGSAAGASANGYVVAKTRAALSADAPGRIVAMNVEEGAVVRKGDVVARLYFDEQEAFLRRADADVDLARAGIERARAEADAARTALEVSRSTLAAAEAEIARSAADVELARASHERIAGLVESKVESAQRLDEARSALDSGQAGLRVAQARAEAARRAVLQSESQAVAAEAAVREGTARLAVLRAERDQAQAALDKTYVRAPFDGIVVLKDAEVGEVVSPNVQSGGNARGSVVTMVDFSSLEVQAEVPETSLAAVRAGAPARVFLDAYPEQPYAGRVSRIWPTANRTKATVEVRVELEQLDERLRPEMGVRIVFLGEEPAPSDGSAAGGEPLVLIPSAAVVRADGKTAVFLVERDTVRLAAIVAGDESGERVAVRDGLAGGEEVVVRPPASLQDGDRIRRKEAP